MTWVVDDYYVVEQYGSNLLTLPFYTEPPHVGQYRRIHVYQSIYYLLPPSLIGLINTEIVVDVNMCDRMSHDYNYHCFVYESLLSSLHIPPKPLDSH